MIDVGLMAGRWVFIALVAFFAFSQVRQMVANMARTTQATRAAEGLMDVGGRVDLVAGPPSDAEVREEQLQTMSEERPEEMATLIKSWMTER